MASCGIDGALRIWDSAGVLVTESLQKGWSTDLAWRPNSDEVAAGIGRRVVRFLGNLGNHSFGGSAGRPFTGGVGSSAYSRVIRGSP